MTLMPSTQNVVRLFNGNGMVLQLPIPTRLLHKNTH